MQIIYWAMFSIIYAFANSFLSMKGFNAYEIGMLIALSSFFSVFIQPLCAKLVDKYENINSKNILYISLLLIIISSILIHFTYNKELLFLLYMILIISLLNTQTFMYTYIFEYINAGYVINFGLARGLGSAFFGITSLIVGKLGSKYSFNFIPVTIFLLAIFVLLVTFTFEKINIEKINSKEVYKDKFIDFFLKYRNFTYLLIGIILIFYTHNTLNTFLKNIIEYYGKSSQEIGMIFLIAAILELPIMYSIDYLNKKFKFSTLLKFSSISFSIKAIITYVSVYNKDMGLLYLAQIFQMGAYAIYVPVTVYYVNNLMDEKDRLKGQAYLASSATIGAILGTLISGKIIEISSIKYMLLISMIISILGTLIMYINLKKKN